MEDTPENKDSNTYKVRVRCSNCGFDGETEIKKGVPVEGAFCPNCGNPTLERLPRSAVMGPGPGMF